MSVVKAIRDSIQIHDYIRTSEILKENEVIEDIDQYFTGLTCLHLVCLKGATELCYELLQKGANPNIPSKGYRVTPLHLAAANGHYQCAHILLTFGSDCDIENAKRWTPLHSAVKNGHIECVNILLHNGASLTAKTVDNRTVMGVADMYRQKNVILHIKDYLETVLQIRNISKVKGSSNINRKTADINILTEVS